jgi:hypothetical protein
MSTKRTFGASVSAGLSAALLLSLFPAANAGADEIRLKDGKKLYGVIVAYEDDMFKVKTDFGYVLVEKDKIASIVPSTPAAEAKKDPAGSNKKESDEKSATKPETMPAIKPAAESVAEVKVAAVKSSEPGNKPEKPAKISEAAVRPSVSAGPASAAPAPPALKSAPPNTSSLAAQPAPPVPPRDEPPVNREQVQGNLYSNLTYGFRMYKAPSWKILEDARSALPNAIVAMGTSEESTLMVVGREKSKESLEATAKAVESRLREVYEGYRLLSERKAQVSGLPAEEFRYRGKADGRDWSGTLVVVARGPEIFTVLGMTYADTDLIQIQENVIARAIASLDFNAK